MKKFQVIGGQYERHWYGESDSLHGAKIIAAKHDEYWDNWAGWHRPNIYCADDVIITIAKGMITYRDGEKIIVPRCDAQPIATYDHNTAKWTD